MDACIDLLGRDFVKKYQNTSSSGYGDRGDHVFCFVGVDDRPAPEMKGELVLTSDRVGQFPYMARCNVRYNDGHVDFLDCILP